MSRKLIELRVVIIAIAILLLAGCASPLAGAAPRVLVTRVPIEATSLAPVAVVAENHVQPAPASDAGGGAGQATPAPAPASASLTAQEQIATPDAPRQAAVLGDPSLRPLQQTRNILLLGTDQRDLADVGRTDSIMVLAIDAANNRAALVSFPRDIYLPIPGFGYSRINTAFPYGEEIKPGGGLPLLMSTIDKNFGIPIERYVRIDFSGFKDLIEALGGVDITVDCPLNDELIPRYFGVDTLEPGVYHMNGEQALYYSRSRKTTNDFDRARRQQRVLLAVRSRILDGNLLPRIPALWQAMRDIVDTNLKPGEIVDLAQLGANLQAKNLYGMVIRYPLVTDWVTAQGGMVQMPDLPAINDALDNIWQRAPLQQTSHDERVCQPRIK